MCYDSTVIPVNRTRLIKLLQDFMPETPINRIKVMRELTGLGLKESKDFMESLDSKFYVKTDFGLDGYSPGFVVSNGFKTFAEADAFRANCALRGSCVIVKR